MNSEYKVECFDEIEALYRRYQFYKSNNLKYLYQDLGDSMWYKYADVKTHTHLNSKEAFNRAKDIDSMFREVYYSCLEENKWLKHLKCITPRFYYICREKKSKILRRMKFLFCLLKYIYLSWNSDCCLVNTPTHGNLGDHAITLAEEQLLQKYSIKYTELTAQQLNSHEKYFAYITPRSKVIAIHGGGYLGMLWPIEEYRLRNILKAFHNHKIIIFPQTVTFNITTHEGRVFFEESKKVYYSHPNLTIFVREKKSYEFMRKYMPKINVILVPDIATLFNVPLVFQNRKDILFCMQKVPENCVSEEDCHYIINMVQKRYPTWRIHGTDTILNQQIMPKAREKLVHNKLFQFSQARLVITDQLHGMIFSAITGTPCIALGNSNSKVKDAYEWLKSNPYINYLDDPKQINRILKELDCNEEYHFQIDFIEKSFLPLTELIQKDFMF